MVVDRHRKSNKETVGVGEEGEGEILVVGQEKWGGKKRNR